MPEAPRKLKETDHPHVSATFSEAAITVSFHSDEAEDFDTVLPWDAICRVCYRTYDYGAPDFIHLFVDDGFEPEAIVPVTETGGEDLWTEVLRRGLFSWKEVGRRIGSNRIDCYPKRPKVEGFLKWVETFEARGDFAKARKYLDKALEVAPEKGAETVARVKALIADLPRREREYHAQDDAPGTARTE